MANTIRRVPIAPKMHPFQAEIGGYKQFRTRSNTDNGSVISYSNGKFPSMPESSCLTANGGDKLSFGSRQGSTNIRSVTR
jgi:hypothetical protein